MALNHLFWSEKSHTGLHLAPCSSWHRLKHAILLSSILCVTFQVPPEVPAKAQFPLARTVITSTDKNVCFQFKPTQFHLAPVLTLLGSRDSAGAAAGEGNGCCAADFRSTSLSLWDLVSGFFEKVVEINVLSKNKPQSPIKHRVWYWPDWSGSAWLSQPFHSAEGKKQFPKLGRNWKGFLLPIQPEIPFFLCFGQHHYFKPTPEEGFCTRYLLMEFPPLPRAFQRKEAGFKACELLASLVIVHTVWQIHEQVC